jgi:hypothetical protein
MPLIFTYWHDFGGVLEENEGMALIFHCLFKHVEVSVIKTIAIFSIFGMIIHSSSGTLLLGRILFIVDFVSHLD